MAPGRGPGSTSLMGSPPEGSALPPPAAEVDQGAALAGALRRKDPPSPQIREEDGLVRSSGSLWSHEHLLELPSCVLGAGVLWGQDRRGPRLHWKMESDSGSNNEYFERCHKGKTEDVEQRDLAPSAGSDEDERESGPGCVEGAGVRSSAVGAGNSTCKGPVRRRGRRLGLALRGQNASSRGAQNSRPRSLGFPSGSEQRVETPGQGMEGRATMGTWI